MDKEKLREIIARALYNLNPCFDDMDKLMGHGDGTSGYPTIKVDFEDLPHSDYDGVQDNCEADAIALIAVLQSAGVSLLQWNTDMSQAPRGGGAERVTDPDYVYPPHLLLRFGDGTCVVCHWEAYYAEGGHGHREAEGQPAWVGVLDGSLVCFDLGHPTAWAIIPLPEVK